MYGYGPSQQGRVKVETNLGMMVGVSLLSLFDVRKDELEDMNDTKVLSVATSMIMART